MSEKSQSAYGRRDIIKKTAVAGAVAWTAPMIVSSRALAVQGSDEQGPGCQYYAIVKIEGSGPTLGTLFCGLDQGYVQANPTSQAVVSSGYTENGGGCFTLPTGVLLVAVIGKKGPPKAPDVCQAATAKPNGMGGYCVDGGFSHINVVVCRSNTRFDGETIKELFASRPLDPVQEQTLTEPKVADEPAPVVEPAQVVEQPSGG